MVNALGNAFYLLIGRKLRSRLADLPYSWVVFLGAAVITTLVVAVTRTTLTGYSARGYSWVVAITVLSQVFGHIPINAVLRFYSATTVSMVMQASVVIAVVLAFFAFGEAPSALQVIGSAFVLAGVILVLRENGGTLGKNDSGDKNGQHVNAVPGQSVSRTTPEQPA